MGLALREARSDEMDHISYRTERYQYYTTVITKLFLRQFAFLRSDWSVLYSALILEIGDLFQFLNICLYFVQGAML